MSRIPIHVPPAPAPSPLGVLRLRGTEIVGSDGKPLVLRGAGLGGHLNMENSPASLISGYPGHEYGMRRALKKVLGEEKADFFLDKFLEYFFTEKDAEFFASLGLNCIRVPFNYRHFEDDMNPGVYNERGFQWLDRIINILASYGIYTILDLHAAPVYIEFQNRAIALWEELARRYKGNTWVAGYNPLNEPTDEDMFEFSLGMNGFKRQFTQSIPITFCSWTVILGLFSFKEALPGACYAIHDYSNFGFPSGDPYKGTPEQQAKLERQFKRKIEFHERVGCHIWNGEFGPVYASPSDGPDWESINEDRYRLLKDQLALYDTAKISWSIWLYKDIGFQGMVYAGPDTAYIKHLKPFLEKKKRVAADEWGADVKVVKHIFDPLEEWLIKEAPGIKQRYPRMWNVSTHVGRLVRNILLSEELYPEYAEYFRDMSLSSLTS
ncbi:Cellulase (glycosyl hydrolase family 5 protein) [Rhizoctonia solani]|uniref:Cellulase (Glycosyl hydrolase family 5 protein) n=1 Tax=Rhizoctonia solani TaxID=456999 RepID=A0A8H8NRD1_9AGAM|nr:Cellulase (glycosyl hydrolase family 5 protein) [Rhizoctonia solani]QRW18115.1 Cellulase (glycosyl hydrolase family 5 protein) [Rhizoctonia solani]